MAFWAAAYLLSLRNFVDLIELQVVITQRLLRTRFLCPGSAAPVARGTVHFTRSIGVGFEGRATFQQILQR